jgi:hypothetical protein
MEEWMIELNSGADCKTHFGSIMADRGVYALLLVVGTDSDCSTLATRADVQTAGQPWREVVWDNGCEALSAADKQRLFGNHGAIGVMLGDAWAGDRKPVAWLGASSDVVAIENAFTAAEAANSHDPA